MDALDVRANSAQLLHDVLVSTVDVIHAIDQCLSACHQSRQHQTRAGTQIGSLHNGSRECGWAVYFRRMSFDRDVRTHAHHLTRVQKAVLKNSFDNHRRAFGLRR
jgi:hypothetical protein